ncbi:MAG: caffeoyl-CoA O-methyltransferase [Solirubrobacterales bacterium]|nr:caffeoyl-CoA O-methyltransferase [Solirubrobacterales bacterium]
MPDKFTVLTPELHRYIVEHGARRDKALLAVEESTEAMGDIARMQTAPDQAALMTLLVKAIGARRAIEVGTFTGYGAIAIARGLPDDGELICCELSEEYAEISRKNIETAGLASLVRIDVGPALATLRALPAAEDFDFAYIDADKAGYDGYYEECLARLRPRGLIMLDNVLLSGRVLDPPADDESAQALAELNEKLAADERIEIAMLGIADGVTLALKR